MSLDTNLKTMLIDNRWKAGGGGGGEAAIKVVIIFKK